MNERAEKKRGGRKRDGTRSGPNPAKLIGSFKIPPPQH